MYSVISLNEMLYYILTFFILFPSSFNYGVILVYQVDFLIDEDTARLSEENVIEMKIRIYFCCLF